MTEEKIFKPLTEERGKNAHIKSMEEYKGMYDKSIHQSDEFWEEIAKKNFHFEEPWTKVSSSNFDIKKGTIGHKWFEGAKTNLSYNCLDRHLEKVKKK
jgi:acetyl-CoA synthetase